MCIGTLLFAAALVVLQGKEERSVEEELAALIEKTNALESFHLVYDLKIESGDSSRQGTLEVVHRSPDLGHLRLRIEDVGMESWVDETLYYSRSDSGGQDGEWRAARLPETPPAALLMNELFPPTERLLGPGVYFDLKVRKDSKSGEFQVKPTMGRKLSRTCLFGWLKEMRSRASEVSAEEHCLVLDDAGCRYMVSRESGLLERAEISTENGRLEIRMRESFLDEPLDDENAEIPEGVRLASLDPELSRTLQELFAPGYLRQEGFHRLERLLASELRLWNERTRDDWRAFLNALHRDMITKQKSGWIDQLREYADEIAEWVSSQRAQNNSPERLAELELEAAKKRAKLEENFERAHSKYVDDLPAVESKFSEPRQELFDIETQVIADLWDELLREPVLKAYDEKLVEALKR